VIEKQKYKKKGLIITIDGPAGAGKSTIAKKIAQKIGYNYVNTGVFYRYITYCALKENININDHAAINQLSKKVVEELLKINNSTRNLNIFSKNTDKHYKIIEEIHSPKVNQKVSNIAQIPNIRKNLMPLQHMIARNGSVVVEGRDIGSVVLPEADLKFYIIADEIVRIIRRYKELREKGYKISLNEVEKEIKKRDYIDSKRKIAPLVKPKDAIVIDTTNKRIDEVIDDIYKIIQATREKRNENL